MTGICLPLKSEYDIKELIRFAREMEELFCFKRDKTELNDICYGSKVVFCMDKTGHLDISGKIFGHAAEQCLEFDLQPIKPA